MNIVNNAGWDTEENHSLVIDKIWKAKRTYDTYMEDHYKVWK